jgi:hypothetical protein
LREPIHDLPCRAVGQLAPVALALGEEQAVRSALDRRTEEAGEARVVRRHGFAGAAAQAAVVGALVHNSGNRIGDRAQRRWYEHFGVPACLVLDLSGDRPIRSRAGPDAERGILPGRT